MLNGKNAQGQDTVVLDYDEVLGLPVRGLDLRSEAVTVNVLIAYAARAAAGMPPGPGGAFSIQQAGRQWTITYL